MENQAAYVPQKKAPLNASLEMFRIGGDCYKTFRANFNRDYFAGSSRFADLHIRPVPDFNYLGPLECAFHDAFNKLSYKSIPQKSLIGNKSFIKVSDVLEVISDLKKDIKKEIDEHNAIYDFYTEAMIISLEVMNLVYGSYFDQRDYAIVKPELITKLSAYIPVFAKNQLLSSNVNYLTKLSKTIAAVAQSEARPSFCKAQELAVKFLIRFNEYYMELLRGENPEYSFVKPRFEEVDLQPLEESVKSVRSFTKTIDKEKHECYRKTQVSKRFQDFKLEHIVKQRTKELKLRFKKYCNLATYVYEEFHNTNDHIADGYGERDPWKKFGGELDQLNAKFKALENDELVEYTVETSNWTTLCTEFLYKDEKLKQILSEFMVEYEKLKAQAVVDPYPLKDYFFKGYVDA